MSYQPKNVNGQATMANSEPVVIASDQTAVPVSGTVTANIGTVSTLATAAKQDTIIGHVDGIETVLGTIDADTGAIKTALETAGGLVVNLGTNNDVTVTGTVDLGATDNAVLDDIAADTEAIKTALAGTLTVTGGGGGVQYTEGDTDATITGTAILWEDTGNTLTPVSAAKPLPIDTTGLATTAKQDTIIGHLDGVEGLLTTIDADTGAIKTALETAGGLVVNLGANNDVIADGSVASGSADSGNPVKIGGRFNTTKPTLTDGQRGDIQLTPRSNIIIEGADAGGSTQTGNPIVVALRDPSANAQNLAAISTGDGVNGTRVVATGNTLFNGSTYDRSRSIVNATNSTGTGITAAGLVAQYDDTSPTAITENQFGNLRMSSNRNLYVTLRDAAGNERGLNIDTSGFLTAKGAPSDIDINGSNANHADKYYTNAGAVTDGIIWSPAAGKRWHILTLYINVSAAATVTIEDDLAAGDVVRWKGELSATSGVTLNYDKEHPFCSGEDGADLLITTTAGNVYVQAVGYEV